MEVTQRARSLLSVLASRTGLGLSATGSVVAAFVALAVRCSFLLLSTGRLLLLNTTIHVVQSGLTTLLVALAMVHGLGVVVEGAGHGLVDHSGCSPQSGEDVGVRFLQLGKHFLAVLRLREASRELLNRLEDLTLEISVVQNSDSLLQDVVAELVGDQPVYDLVHTELAASRVEAELPHEALVVPEVRTLEDLLDLTGSLTGLKALFDHVR